MCVGSKRGKTTKIQTSTSSNSSKRSNSLTSAVRTSSNTQQSESHEPEKKPIEEQKEAKKIITRSEKKGREISTEEYKKAQNSIKAKETEEAMKTIEEHDNHLDRNAVKIMFERKEKPKEKVERHIGDVNFPKLTDRSEGPEDDTKYERRTTGKRYSYGKRDRSESATTTTTGEFEGPDELNYMWNVYDMEFVTHEIMYKMNRKEAGEPQTIPPISPYEPLDKLERPEYFTWKGLRANSYLTNVTSLPTHDEVEHVPTGTDDMTTLRFIMPSMDLSSFAAKLNVPESIQKTQSLEKIVSGGPKKAVVKVDSCVTARCRSREL